MKAANASLEMEKQQRQRSDEIAASSSSSRDSEVMALKLKLENIERSSSDYKAIGDYIFAVCVVNLLWFWVRSRQCS